MTCEIVLICEIEEYQASLISRYFNLSRGNPSNTASGLGQRQETNNLDSSRSYQEAQKMILKGPDYEKLVRDLQTDATAYRPTTPVKNNRISHEIGRIPNSPMIHTTHKPISSVPPEIERQLSSVSSNDYHRGGPMTTIHPIENTSQFVSDASENPSDHSSRVSSSEISVTSSSKLLVDHKRYMPQTKSSADSVQY